ncbi:hypothetical protein AMAG_01577 [Allomyces macrogynus ATCC 38327]|uniref:Pyridoxamine 5'-phosphate oxidase Alr4036 family FMN-binding domain-containing protein n=1 Tax=Allomyces macrogynus (strain ATCC 38327) TaxID=578462 RepID=A0A0L0S001_ALLM3|nr:hypothetical protein AMAG_01577 [Allomyces macrogynus ATCC 38327]|eukprot:KNE55691.1 hypothetical protein AMAG_01577 [Allomyces macrogynus ATCC 38327]
MAATAAVASAWPSQLVRAFTDNLASVSHTAKYLQLATIDPLLQVPRVRTVVFRGVLVGPTPGPASPSTERDAGPYAGARLHLADSLPNASSAELTGSGPVRLVFVTDARSNKVAHVLDRGARGGTAPAEACWYMPTTREQFRVSGAMAVILASPRGAAQRAQTLRAELWRSLSPAARAAYLAPNPGSYFPPEGPAPAATPATASLEAVSDHFAVLVLDPDEVGYLDLRQPHPHARTVWKRAAAAGAEGGDATDAAAGDGEWVVTTVYA